MHGRITQNAHPLGQAYLLSPAHSPVVHVCCLRLLVQDVLGEIAEFRAASSLMSRWSELSDVTYTYTRACAAGHSFRTPAQPSWVSRNAATRRTLE
jgi:hypothetical protein